MDEETQVQTMPEVIQVAADRILLLKSELS